MDGEGAGLTMGEKERLEFLERQLAAAQRQLREWVYSASPGHRSNSLKDRRWRTMRRLLGPQAPAEEPAPSPGPLVTLDDLIGELPEITKTQGTMESRGLTVTWWRYASADADKPPIIGLHGGPAFTHNYILPLKLLATTGHPVILYDQAGCGESTFVEDPERDSPWLLTIEYYVEELTALVGALHLGSAAPYYVYGSSWGSVLAQEFAVTQPTGLLGLVLMDWRMQTYIKTQWRDRISPYQHTQGC